MVKDPLFIGLDFGSDSVRALAVDAGGNERATATACYPRWQQGRFSDAATARFRQHPLDYLECMDQVMMEVLSRIDRSKVAGIGVDTTGSTICPMDKEGRLLALREEFADDPDAMFVLWKDHTGIAEAERINQIAKGWAEGDYTRYSGGVYSCEFYWSKVLHILRCSPAVAQEAAAFVEHCSWICAELSGTGIRQSRCAAGHKALWHADWGGLPPVEFFAAIAPELVKIRQNMSSTTFTADQPYGFISAGYAAKWQLPADVVIAGGAFDCHSGAVGCGIMPGEMVKVIGTSTCDIAVSDREVGMLHGICGQVDGSVVPGMTGFEAGQSAFGDVYAWFGRFLSYGGKVDIAELEKEAMLVPPGAGGIAALDWFNGRRSPYADYTLHGALCNLNLGSTPPMVFRALVESTVFGSKAITECFRNQGVAVKTVKAIGGISRKSQLVMQTFADVLEMPVMVAASTQCCALGAAIFAALAAGYYPDYASAAAQMASPVERTYVPDTANSAVYRELYRRYLELGGKLS